MEILPFLAESYPELASVVEAWPNLSDDTKATILALIKSGGVPSDASE